MAKRVIIWTETAARQRREILKYWHLRNRSPNFSRKLIDLIAARTQAILKYPKSFKKTAFPDTRVSSMGHFSIFYKVTQQHLIITAFWDNRQDPKKLLNLLSH